MSTPRSPMNALAVAAVVGGAALARFLAPPAVVNSTGTRTASTVRGREGPAVVATEEPARGRVVTPLRSDPLRPMALSVTTPAAPPREDPAAPRRVLSTEEIVSRTEQSVALVRGQHSLGTGFLVRPRLLVTNAHVIEKESVPGLRVTFPSAAPARREARVVDLVWEDPGRDLAFLSVDTELPALALETDYRFRRGQEVTIIGSPGTSVGDVLENAVSRGVMSTPVSIGRRSYFQMSVAINPGNSGGPVIGSEGLVLGVATLKDGGKEGIAFCIPVDELARSLGQVDRLPPDAAARTHALHAARPVFRLLDETAKTYVTALEAFSQTADTAAARGADPADALATAERIFRTRGAAELHELTVKRVYPDLCRALADPELPRPVAENLNQLWRLVLDLQKAAEQPEGTPAELLAASTSQGDRRRVLAARIAAAFEATASSR